MADEAAITHRMRSSSKGDMHRFSHCVRIFLRFPGSHPRDPRVHRGTTLHERGCYAIPRTAVSIRMPQCSCRVNLPACGRPLRPCKSQRTCPLFPSVVAEGDGVRYASDPPETEKVGKAPPTWNHWDNPSGYSIYTTLRAGPYRQFSGRLRGRRHALTTPACLWRF